MIKVFHRRDKDGLLEVSIQSGDQQCFFNLYNYPRPDIDVLKRLLETNTAGKVHDNAAVFVGFVTPKGEYVLKICKYDGQGIFLSNINRLSLIEELENVLTMEDSRHVEDL